MELLDKYELIRSSENGRQRPLVDLLEPILNSKSHEKEARSNGYIYSIARFDFAGLTLWRSTSRLVIPAPLLGISAVLMLLSVIFHNILYYESLDWMNKAIDYGWSSLFLTSAYTILMYKRDIIALSLEVDRWWKYPYLEKVTAQFKKKSEDWMKIFNFMFFGIGYISTSIYCLLPLAKWFNKKPSERMEALLFQVWTPQPFHSTWGFFVTYTWEVMTIVMTSLLYNKVFVLLMTFTVVFKYQAKLIGIAIVSIKERTRNMMKNKRNLYSEEWHKEYNRLLDKEIRSSVVHFQHLYKSSLKLSRALSSITNVTYHGGMWVLCSVGVKAATEMTFVIMVQAFMLVGVIIWNLYVYSFVSEFLLEEIQKLRNLVYDSPWYEMPIKSKRTFHIFLTMLDADRFPTLRTVLGTKTNMENLSKVVNASYYYFSMIITMKSN